MTDTLLRVEGKMGKAIEIVDYDPQWALLYEEEKRRILEVIGDIIV